ncbi:MAG: uncharacterized protein A8A55_1075 [Amphiamblys sp. WSBS2006]|nr:MAG: uncharacterized protein A8A55_1075 [Amphiamblys sp. WSBS2006]
MKKETILRVLAGIGAVERHNMCLWLLLLANTCLFREKHRAVKIFILERDSHLVESAEIKEDTLYTEVYIPNTLRAEFKKECTVVKAASDADYVLVPHALAHRYERCIRHNERSRCEEGLADYFLGVLRETERIPPQRLLFVFSHPEGLGVFGDSHKTAEIRQRIEPSAKVFSTEAKDRAQHTGPVFYIPPFERYTELRGLKKPETRKRKVFAFLNLNRFISVGTYDLATRIASFADVADRRLLVADSPSFTQYINWQALLNARCAVCPRGRDGWSVCVYEALVSSTVPIVVSDGEILPSSIKDAGMLIQVPEKDVDTVLEHLKALTEKDIGRYVEKSGKARHHFYYCEETPDSLSELLKLLGK